MACSIVPVATICLAFSLVVQLYTCWFRIMAAVVPPVASRGFAVCLIVPFIKNNDQTIVYVADLIPVATNIPISWISAYDIEPLKSLKEKEEFLKEAQENNYILFFEHDIYNECCTLKMTEKGVRMDKSYKLNEILN